MHISSSSTCKHERNYGLLLYRRLADHWFFRNITAVQYTLHPKPLTSACSKPDFKKSYLMPIQIIDLIEVHLNAQIVTASLLIEEHGHCRSRCIALWMHYDQVVLGLMTSTVVILPHTRLHMEMLQLWFIRQFKQLFENLHAHSVSAQCFTGG